MKRCWAFDSDGMAKGSPLQSQPNYRDVHVDAMPSYDFPGRILVHTAEQADLLSGRQSKWAEDVDVLLPAAAIQSCDEPFW